MARVFYCRVSTAEQNEGRQIVAAQEAKADKIFTDKATGANTNRPQLRAMMDYIREGDVVIVESISRLARSTKDLLTKVEEITAKGAEFISLKESIDTQTPQGKFMLTVFAAMAELEKEQTAQRRDEGIALRKAEDAARKAKGLEPLYYKGRQAIGIDERLFREEVRKWRDGEQTAVETMRRLNLKPNTFYRRVKERGL